MAQEGDTITYTYSDGTSVAEDVSDVGEVVVDYCDGAGGISEEASGGAGGRVENATIDVSNQSTLYIWVASQFEGRYQGQSDAGGIGGGSTEISFSNTERADGADEPFLVASGGGAGGAVEDITGVEKGGQGARGDSGDVFNADGLKPPDGGDGVADLNAAGGDGDGAIDDQNRGLVSGGTTIKGGGSPADTNGEIQLTFQSGLSPPDPPSNLTAEVQ